MATLGTFTGVTEITKLEIERPTNGILMRFSFTDKIMNWTIFPFITELSNINFSLTLENRGEEKDIANRCPLLPCVELAAKMEGFFPVVNRFSHNDGTDDLFIHDIGVLLKINPDDANFDLRESEQFVLSLYNLNPNYKLTLTTYELNTYNREILNYNRQTIRKETLKEFDNSRGKFLGTLFCDNNFHSIDKSNETEDGTIKTQRVEYEEIKMHNMLEEDATYVVYDWDILNALGLLANGKQAFAKHLWLDLSEIDSFQIQASDNDCQIINITEQTI